MDEAAPFPALPGFQSKPVTSEGPRLATWNLLQELGFQPDPTVWSDNNPGLSFDFGNLKLNASAVAGRRFVPVVLLTGVLQTQRRIGMIEYEMPKELKSRELGLAILAYALDHHVGGEGFQPMIPTLWLEVGRGHRGLLPWVREAADRKNPQKS